MTADPFMGFAATARALEKSRTTVYRLMSSGMLTPHYRPRSPRSPVFLRSEVEALNVPGPKEPVQNLALHREAKARDRRCVICYFSGERLIAHHVVPVEQGGDDVLGNLVTLCPGCHANVHSNGYGLKRRAREHGTEAVTNWLLAGTGVPQIAFGAA